MVKDYNKQNVWDGEQGQVAYWNKRFSLLRIGLINIKKKSIVKAVCETEIHIVIIPGGLTSTPQLHDGCINKLL